MGQEIVGANFHAFCNYELKIMSEILDKSGGNDRNAKKAGARKEMIEHAIKFYESDTWKSVWTARKF